MFAEFYVNVRFLQPILVGKKRTETHNKAQKTRKNAQKRTILHRRMRHHRFLIPPLACDVYPLLHRFSGDFGCDFADALRFHGAAIPIGVW